MKTIVMIGILSVGFTGCQELLPPREDPNGYFKTELVEAYDVFYPENPVYRRNQVIIFLRIINNLDDVVQDYIDVSGNVVITWQIPPGDNQYGLDPKRTIPVTAANIITAKGYDRTSGLLTFAPNDTIILAGVWNFKTNDSTNLLGKFSQRIDYRCIVYDNPEYHESYRRVTTLQQFTVTASVRLTKKTSTFYFRPYSFYSCFVIPYYTPMRQHDGHDCIDESGIDPCKLIE
jgi:hypothetical protein